MKTEIHEKLRQLSQYSISTLRNIGTFRMDLHGTLVQDTDNEKLFHFRTVGGTVSFTAEEVIAVDVYSHHIEMGV